MNEKYSSVTPARFPPVNRNWKRFSGYLSWLEVTRVASGWWQSSGPGHFVAIQVYSGTIDEPLYALFVAVDGHTSFHALFCDPTQCSGACSPGLTPDGRFEDETGEACTTESAACPASHRWTELMNRIALPLEEHPVTFGSRRPTPANGPTIDHASKWATR